MKRLLIVLATLLVAVTFLPSSADASPQWRLRRWSSRPPIDPSIRETPRFSTTSAYSSRTYTPRRAWRRR